MKFCCAAIVLSVLLLARARGQDLDNQEMDDCFKESAVLFGQECPDLTEWIFSNGDNVAAAKKPEQIVRAVHRDHVGKFGLQIAEFNQLRQALSPTEFEDFMASWRQQVSDAEHNLQNMYRSKLREELGKSDLAALMSAWFKSSLMQHGTRVFENAEVLALINADEELSDVFVEINSKENLLLNNETQTVVKRVHAEAAELIYNGVTISKILLEYSIR